MWPSSAPAPAGWRPRCTRRPADWRSFEGFVKLIAGPPGDDRILGVRAVGPQADNVIGEAAVLIDNRIPYTYLLDAVHAHPSLAESLQNAARIIAGTLPATF